MNGLKAKYITVEVMAGKFSQAEVPYNGHKEIKEMRNIKEQVRNMKDESGLGPSVCLTGDLGNMQRNIS